MFQEKLTKLGLVEHLKVPRDREGQFQPSVITRYQRRQDKVNNLVREAFLGGLSTRRIGEVLKPVLGEAVSPETVSRITRSLERDVERSMSALWRMATGTSSFDGIVLKVKGLGGGVKKKLVFCAYGITLDGQREMLSFRQGTAESEAQWEAFLRDLYERG